MTNSTALRSPLTAIETALHSDPRLKSRHTTRQYLAGLRDFEIWRDGREMNKLLVEVYLSHLQNAKYAPNSINQRISAVKWWARKVEDIAADHADDPRAARVAKQAARILTVRGVKGKRLHRGRNIPREERDALIAVCKADTSPAGVRDAAMIAVAVSVGLRRDDLTSLQMGAIQNESGQSCDLVINGKGDRVDKLYLYDWHGGYTALRAWLTLRGDAPGTVFCPVRKNDRINITGRLSGESLRRILDLRQMQAGITDHIGWHDLRRTFGTLMLSQYGDLSLVQKLMRHEDPKTTTIYDLRAEQHMREALSAMQEE